MSTTDTMRAAFEAWMQTRPGYPFAGSFANLMWASWQAATEAAKATGVQKRKNEAVQDVRLWMGDHDVVLSNKAYSSLTELLRSYEGAKATGTAGEQPKQTVENIEELPPLPKASGYDTQWRRYTYTEGEMRTYGQACAEAARQPAPVVAVKTWQERVTPEFHKYFALHGYGPAEGAMMQEIADLRAALAARSQP